MQVDDPMNAGKLRISELDPGDVFRDTDGSVCIMTDGTEDDEIGSPIYFDPATEHLFHCDGDPLVAVLDARIVVEDEE